MVDLLVWVVDPQKYADASLHEGYLQPLAGHAAAMLVVLNQVDLLAGQGDRAREDLRRVLGGYGLGDVPVLARVRSDRRGHGATARRRSRIASATGRPRWHAWRPTWKPSPSHSARPRAKGAPPGIGRREREQLVAALADAAGLPGVVRAVERAHRHRGALAAGVPWTAWLRRLRPDPLRRLGIGREPQEQARTSLPPASPVQRAQVDSALRTIAVQAATGLPDPWPALARRAATANESELADRLDQAVAGADLRMAAGPRWWHAARWLQRALAASPSPVSCGWPCSRAWATCNSATPSRRRTCVVFPFPRHSSSAGCSSASSLRRSRGSPIAGAHAAAPAAPGGPWTNGSNTSPTNW